MRKPPHVDPARLPRRSRPPGRLAYAWYVARFRWGVRRDARLGPCLCGHSRMAHVDGCGACSCNGYRAVPVWARLAALVLRDRDRR